MDFGLLREVEIIIQSSEMCFTGADPMAELAVEADIFERMHVCLQRNAGENKESK